MLKRLMLNKKLKEKRELLEGINTRAAELVTRESQLATAIEEAKTDEERLVVEESVAEFEKDKAAIEAEKTTLGEEIAGIESEIAALDANKPTETPVVVEPKQTEERGGTGYMNKRMFFGLQRSEFGALVERSDVKEFIQNVRGLREASQNRAVTGGELGIPTVVLELLRDNLHQYSKLIKYVTLKPVGGKARQLISGVIPEGIWMEAVGSLNELALAFGMVEVDGYKVGGFIPIPNATLEDSDIALASEIMNALGQAIGLAVDKAIVYGTGAKMPKGIAPRLAQATKPADYPKDAPAWENLSTSNVLKFAGTTMEPKAFFKDLILKLSAAKANFANGGKFWVMNSTTAATIMAQSIDFNAAGALVASAQGTMPIIGGDIVILEFMDDNDILGGFGSLYLLAEREGSSLEASTHVRFIQDQTVFKGTARYDGAPVIPKGFVIVNIANVAPKTSMTFAADTANPAV